MMYYVIHELYIFYNQKLRLVDNKTIEKIRSQFTSFFFSSRVIKEFFAAAA